MQRSRFLLALLAALVLPAAALAEGHGRHGGNGGGGGERHGERRGDGRGGEERGSRGGEGRGDRGGEGRGPRGGDERWQGEGRGNGRWNNAGPPGRWNGGGPRGGWDPNRYNGYWMGNRWTFGPPPEAYLGEPGFRPGYSQWRRGTILPPYYRGGYAVPDYYRYRLRRPPLGYHWIRIGADYLLVSDHTGQIFDVIIGGAMF